MTAQIKIIKRVVDSIEWEGTDRFYRSRELPGFGMRVRASGRKFFVTQFRARGRLRRMTLLAEAKTGVDCQAAGAEVSQGVRA